MISFYSRSARRIIACSPPGFEGFRRWMSLKENFAFSSLAGSQRCVYVRRRE